MYEEAYKNLMTKPVHEILKGIELEEVEQADKAEKTLVNVKKVKGMFFAKKMDKLIQRLKSSVYRDNNMTIDIAAWSLGLVKTCIYRNKTNQLKSEDDAEKPNIICDFYLDNVLISSGEGIRRKEAQTDAYNQAWDTLSQTTGERVAKVHKRLTPEESNDPTVIDVIVKGRTLVQFIPTTEFNKSPGPAGHQVRILRGPTEICTLPVQMSDTLFCTAYICT